MHLAFHFGWLDPDALAAVLPERLLQEWMAYNAIDPFERSRTVDRAPAVLSALLANINRGKGQAMRTMDDFMPEFGPVLEGEKQDLDGQIASVLSDMPVKKGKPD